MFVVIWNKYQSINIYCAEYVVFFLIKLFQLFEMNGTVENGCVILTQTVSVNSSSIYI